MRNPEDEIIIHKEPLGSVYKSRLVKIPFLRGLVMLWDALILGMRALTISANTQTGDDEQLEGPLLYLTLGISLTIGIIFFFLAPATIGQFVEKTFGLSSWWGNVVEGIVRLTILIGYIWLVGQYGEIKRVFSYHGAEHKTINAFEAGAELDPETVSQYSLEHPRCGTAFLLLFTCINRTWDVLAATISNIPNEPPALQHIYPAFSSISIHLRSFREPLAFAFTIVAPRDCGGFSYPIHTAIFSVMKDALNPLQPVAEGGEFFLLLFHNFRIKFDIGQFCKEWIKILIRQ